MEAKDTVIRYQKKHPVVAGSAEWHMIDGYNLGAEAQAEISFKAGYREGSINGIDLGRKEVVGWLKAHNWYCSGIEAKLKEWGIE